MFFIRYIYFPSWNANQLSNTNISVNVNKPSAIIDFIITLSRDILNFTIKNDKRTFNIFRKESFV
ncbi:Uncharacterised protein [Serratia marcescens]|nr:Uncharacterised protein [Serratia marcescens]